MNLTEVIDTYRGKITADRGNATLFMLREMQIGDSHRDLRRRYVLLFGLGVDNPTDAYDSIQGEIYDVDPEGDQPDFKVPLGEAVLFRKERKVLDARRAALVFYYKKDFVQRLESLDGLKMDAHIFDPAFELAGGLKTLPDYAGVIAAAETMKLQARSYTG